MNEPTLDPHRTAVLYFDTLKVYLQAQDGGIRAEARSQVAACQRMLAAARALEMPVVYAAADHRADGADWSTTVSDRTPSGLARCSANRACARQRCGARRARR